MGPARRIHPLRRLAALNALLLLAACGTTSVQVADGDKRYPPTEAVDILHRSPSRAHETLASLEARGGARFGLPGDRDAVLRSLGEKAKALGADAVIVTDEKATVTRRGMAYVIRGKAIKYRRAAAHTEPLGNGQPVQVESMAPAGDRPPAGGPETAEPAEPAASPEGDWLSRQPPDYYTVQLLAARQPESIRRFIEEHSLGDDSRALVIQRDGESWHLLVSGSYPTKAAAREAIRSLPPSLQRTRPWPRRIGDLQALVVH